MRALTGVMKYVGIVLLASVLIIAFTIGIMFFVPSVSIFGLYFRQAIASDVVIYTSGQITSAGEGGVITLNIEAGDYHIAIVPRETNIIEVKTNNNYIGLVKATTVTKDNKNLFNDKYLGMRDNKGQLVKVEYDLDNNGEIEEDKGEKNVTITNEIAESKNYNENPNYVEGVKVDQKICVVNPYIEIKDVEKTNEYTYVVKEPSGLMNRNASNVIVFYVPLKAGETEIKYNINVKTNNGDVRLRNSTQEDSDNFKDFLFINELNIETNKGNGNLKGVKTPTSDATIEKDKKGNITSATVTKLVLPSLNIKTNGGTFDFSNYKTVIVNGDVNLESKKAKYKFDVLQSYTLGEDGNYDGNINIVGTNVEFVANKVFCGKDGFSYKSDTGVLKIDKLYTGKIKGGTEEYVDSYVKDGETFKVDKQKSEYFVEVEAPYENTIFTESAVVELGTVVGKLGLQNEMGSVNIGHLSHQATIRTENGNINIKTSGFLLDERTRPTKERWLREEKASLEQKLDAGKMQAYIDSAIKEKVFTETSSLILYSTYGDINVGEYYQDAIMHSKKGQITAVSKFGGIKGLNEDTELTLKKGEKKVAYCGYAKDETGKNTSLKWWRVRKETDGDISYEQEITQDYILAQLSGNDGSSAEYYSNPNYVAAAYYHEAKWWKDVKHTIEITDAHALAQLTQDTADHRSFYFTTVDETQIRYYYTDATTKDGTVTITTEKNPVRIVASDKATINLTIQAVMTTKDENSLVDDRITNKDTKYFADLNPFGSDDYMYIAETKNGKVNVNLPITSFIIQVNCKDVEGTIGATSNVGTYDKKSQTRPEVQINSAIEYQPKVRLSGKKAILSSDI